MYDRQLWYWPERHIFLILKIYLNGDAQLETEDLTMKEVMALLEESAQSGNDVDDYLFIKGMIKVDHLPL